MTGVGSAPGGDVNVGDCAGVSSFHGAVFRHASDLSKPQLLEHDRLVPLVPTLLYLAIDEMIDDETVERNLLARRWRGTYQAMQHRQVDRCQAFRLIDRVPITTRPEPLLSEPLFRLGGSILGCRACVMRYVASATVAPA